MFKELLPENLYHSYVIEGEVDSLSSNLISFLEERGDIKPKSSDMLCQIYDSFTINESKLIRDWNNQKSNGPKKFCILGAKNFSLEAQNSLLKIFEEPSMGTHFFIIVPNSDILLPTLRSRVQVIKNDKVENVLEIKRAKEFIDSKKQERIDLVVKIIKNHDKDENSAGLRHDAINLLNNLESIIYQKFCKDHKNTDLQFTLKQIQEAREYLSIPGGSVKMLLEHIALVI